jgi:hypothetical protein
MGSAAVVCNVVLFALTRVIVVTEGMPSDARYLVLTFLVLLVPPLTAVLLVGEYLAAQTPSTDGGGSSAISLTQGAGVLCNVVLFRASCWAGVAQYPYSEGNSVIPFAAVTIGTPILSLAALLGGGRKAMEERRRSAARSELERGRRTSG